MSLDFRPSLTLSTLRSPQVSIRRGKSQSRIVTGMGNLVAASGDKFIYSSLHLIGQSNGSSSRRILESRLWFHFLLNVPESTSLSCVKEVR